MIQSDGRNIVKLKYKHDSEYCEFDLDLDRPEAEELIKYAKKHIVKDEQALINYAIVKMLGEYVERMQVEALEGKNNVANSD